jgi:hypothetical protein
MNNLQQAQPAPTPETIWAILERTAQLQEEHRLEMKERDRMLTEKFAESDRFLTERFAETERILKESRAEADRFLTERFAETERIFKQNAEAAEKRMKALEELTGNWSNNHGAFAEEYFFNSFEQNKRNFFGEKFDDIDKNVKGIKKNFKDEYDILLVNGKSVGIIEVKFKAHKNDIPKVLKKAQTFRVNFPEYANHQVYLGLATMSFYGELENACKEAGIAIIKQVGDTVVICDEHLKVF